MYLIKAGRRILNLEFMIMSEEGDAGSPVPPGCVRVTMNAGKEFDLVGTEADEFRRAAHRATQVKREGSGEGHATMAVRVDPSSAGVDPVSPGQRKQRG
jgi:hypothetical protein